MIEARCSITPAGGGLPVFRTQTFPFVPEVGDSVVVEGKKDPLLCKVKGRLISSVETGLPPLILRLQEVAEQLQTGKMMGVGGLSGNTKENPGP